MIIFKDSKINTTCAIKHKTSIIKNVLEVANLSLVFKKLELFGSIEQVKLKSPFWQNKTRNSNFVKLTGLINNLKSFVKLIA